MSGIHQLELDVLDDPTVLLRVVSVCHQRQFRIASLRYDRNAGGACLLLGVEGGSTQLPRLQHWLANLIHVVSVRAYAAAVSPGPDGKPRANPELSE